MIGLAIIVLILLGLAFWYFSRTPDEDVTITNQPVTANVAVVDSTIVNAEPASPAETSAEPIELVQLANFFAERYGSYSTDANFANVQNLKVYMTATMQRSADAYVTSQSAGGAVSYTEIVTKVLSTDIQDQSDTASTIRVTTQRTKSGDAFTENDVYYEDLLLRLVQQDGEWKVDSATWMETALAGNDDPTPPDVDADELLEIFNTNA